MIPWLDSNTPFPPLSRALREPNGLLAAGADLAPERLLAAYRQGIFPWYGAGEPILWWSPDPRMVLFPAEIKISRSLRKALRRRGHEVRLDTAFAQIMRECARPRQPGGGTWITPEMRRAYLRMHELGYAHSVETWVNEELVGGLYGIALGKVFFGESMFARRTDASKIAFAHLVAHLERLGFAMIDCQMTTAHLASLGAREIPRTEFVAALRRWSGAEAHPTATGKWPSTAARNLYAEAACAS